MATIVIQVSANREWRSVRAVLHDPPEETTPVGGMVELPTLSGWNAILLHGGVGKVRSAASAQYAISTLGADLLVLIGTCGAVDPTLQELDLILVTKTLVYDFHSPSPETNMNQIEVHTVDLPGGWDTSELPFPVRTGTVASGDGDPDLDSLGEFQLTYGALAVDWESGAVAKICSLNRTPRLILRGVSDLLRSKAEGIAEGYRKNTAAVMQRLWSTLCALLEKHRGPEELPVQSE